MPVRSSLIRVLVLFAICLGITSIANAQGVIVPGPCRRCPTPPIVERPVNLPRALPVKSIKIDTKISSQVATTHVEQVFRNNTHFTLEGTYFFPIPETASIAEFAIWEGDKRLVGEVRTREEARRIYDEIVRRQRDPGLLEYAGKDLFQASIFPIPPNSDKKLEITYTQVVRAEGGTVSYRYPLGTGRQMVEIGSVSGRVEVESKEPLRNVYSPTHSIDVKRATDRRSLVSFESGKEAQDFQLFYTISKEDFGLTLLTHREPGKDGYFLLMISPKEDWADQEYSAKDVVFVVDTSGSMAEEGKMEKARSALLYGVRILRPQDRFNVISFAGDERLMEAGLIAADEKGRQRGEAFVKGLKPVGGTNINGSLLASLAQFTENNRERPKIVVFMTDGLPTVGTTNVAQIVENVRKASKPGVRLFTFGVGYDVNTALLDKLAAENGGMADYVEPKEDLEVKVSSFFTKVNYPVLTDLKLDMGGARTDLIYPRGIPDVFRGSQVTLIGRYSGDANLESVRLTLNGQSGSSARTYHYDNLAFPLRNENNDYLPRLWATRRVGWLMEQVRSNGEQKELRDEIVDLGTRYGIVTPYTSYLATESAEVSNLYSMQPSQRRASNSGFLGGIGRAAKSAPSPGSAADANAPPANSAPAVTLSSGVTAVQESKRAREQQDAAKLKEEARTDAVRRVGGKTFYLIDNVWTDSEFKAESNLPETALTFGSDEYFALLKQTPKLASFFSLGERVVVVFEGRVYRVSGSA
ncbi:MAG TPA: VIT and VWA domain-containing protein [Pyrinomonadaceae bacterium]|nr:VIT and VWA domain-containing protein [Pyrinomonadaceae bacterium]